VDELQPLYEYIEFSAIGTGLRQYFVIVQVHDFLVPTPRRGMRKTTASP
jgi:hypothetical protein